jgi:hypothetical protein
MRTTLDIDDDVLEAAKELAKAEKKSAGAVLSSLARRALTQPSDRKPAEFRGGFRLLPRTGKIVTAEIVEQLLEEDN